VDHFGLIFVPFWTKRQVLTVTIFHRPSCACVVIFKTGKWYYFPGQLQIFFHGLLDNRWCECGDYKLRLSHTWAIENFSRITTSSTRRKRRAIVVGDSQLRGTDGLTRRADPPLREVCCLLGAWVKDIARKLPRLVRSSDYYPLLLFHVVRTKLQ